MSEKTTSRADKRRQRYKRITVRFRHLDSRASKTSRGSHIALPATKHAIWYTTNERRTFVRRNPSSQSPRGPLEAWLPRNIKIWRPAESRDSMKKNDISRSFPSIPIRWNSAALVVQLKVETTSSEQRARTPCSIGRRGLARSNYKTLP